MSFLDEVIANTEVSEVREPAVEVAEFDISSLTDAQRKVYGEIMKLPTVSKIPYTNPHPDFLGSKTGVYGCFRDDTGEPLGGIVKENYVLPTRDQLVQVSMAACQAFDGMDVDVQASMYKASYQCTIKPTADFRREVFQGDTVCPLFQVSLNFAGTGTDNIHMGMFRDACDNLMMMRTLSSWTKKIRHSSSHNRLFEKAVTDCNSLAGDFDNFVERAQQLQQTEVNMQEMVESIFADRIKDNKASKQLKSALREIFERYNDEAEASDIQKIGVDGNWVANGWLAYNALQGYYQHDSPRRKVNNAEIDSYQRALKASDQIEVNAAEKYLLDAVSV